VTPEGRVKEKVKKVLREHNAYYHCPVQNGMGAPSLDFIGCHKSSYFSIETKAGKGKPTPRQETTIKQIRDAGGLAFVINEHDGLEALTEWLTR